MTKRTFWRDVAFPDDLPIGFDNNIGLEVPRGSTAQRPNTPEDGTFRFNTSIGGLEFYSSGSWETLSVSSVTGEANTGTNIGTGLGLFSSKVGAVLQFRTLIPGSNISLVSLGNEIQINASSIGETNTASNVGGGAGLYSTKISSNLQFRTLVSLTPALTIVENGDVVDLDFDTTLTNVVINAENIGTGSTVYDSKVNNTLRFKTIKGDGSTVEVTSSSSEITIGILSNPQFDGTSNILIPRGTTAQRPVTPLNGMIRYNTTNSQFEGYQGSSWNVFATAVGTYVLKGGDSMTGTLNMSGSAGITTNSGDITMNGGSLIMSGSADIDMSSGGNITMNSGATVDGYDVSSLGQTVGAINASSQLGILARTGESNNFARRTITGTANKIAVTDGNGVSGNPTISISDNAIIGGTGAIQIPSGTTAERPSTATGKVRINTTTNGLEFYNGGAWNQAIHSVGGNVTNTINLSGANITMSGAETVDGRDLSADGVIIDALDGIVSGSGFISKSSGGVFISSIMNASTDSSLYGISVLNGSGSDDSDDVEIGLDINGLASYTDLSNDDELVSYDVSTNNNKKLTIQSIINHLNANTLVLESISSLQALDSSTDRYSNISNIIVQCYFTMEDNGFGSYYKDIDDTTTETENFDINGLWTIVDSNSTRWKLLRNGPYNVNQFGLTPDNTGTANSIIFNKLGLVPGTYIFPKGEYTLQAQGSILSDNISIIAENNVTIFGRVRVRASNIFIKGFLFDGSNETESTSRHLLIIQDTDGVTVENCTFQNLVYGESTLNGSDGIYVRRLGGEPTSTTPGFFCQNITLKNIKGYNLSRNLISVVDGRNIRVENISGTPRRALFDAEPNWPFEWLDQIYLDGAFIDGSITTTENFINTDLEPEDPDYTSNICGVGFAVQILGANLDGGDEPLVSNIELKNIRIAGNGSTHGVGLQVSRVRNVSIENVLIENCYSTEGSGGYFDIRGAGSNESNNVKCKNIVIRNCGAARPIFVNTTKNFQWDGGQVLNCGGTCYITGRAITVGTLAAEKGIVKNVLFRDVGTNGGYTFTEILDMVEYDNCTFHMDTKSLLGCFRTVSPDTRRQLLTIKNSTFIDYPLVVSNGGRLTQLIFEGNKLINCGDDTQIIASTMDAPIDTNLTSLVNFKNNYLLNCSGRINIETCDEFFASGNMFYNSGVSGTGTNDVSIRSIATRSVVENNIFRDTRGTPSQFAVQFGDTAGARKVTMTGNIIEGTGSTDGIDITRVHPSHIITNNQGIPLRFSVASATTLTLPALGTMISVSGTTNITSITATGNDGRIVSLLFDDVLTVTDGLNLIIDGDLTTSTGTTLTLMCNGTNWYEISRAN